MSFSPSVNTAPSLQFTPNWIMVALALLFLPLLLSLGFWQLDRAEQKRELQARFDEQQARPPIALENISVDELAPFSRVIARGQFDKSRTWLVDNRQRDGRPGYEIVQLLTLDSGAQLLVNRGWVEAPVSRRELPDIVTPTGVLTLFGQVAAPETHRLLSARADNSGWPRRITLVVPDVMAEDVAGPLASNYLKLDDASAGVFVAGWQPVNTTETKHTGYAVQWFAMALALVVLSFFANTNLAAWWRGRKH